MLRSEKILKRLELLHPKQIDLSLNRSLKLLKKLGDPHKKLPPTIHVAGTNGKGSTIAFLRSIFEKNSLKVHTYTSPHLIKFNERIRINSKIIQNDLLIELLEECEFYNKKNPITFFEITTVAAYLGFSRIKSDILLLETGLGGKFDATNVIPSSFCTVITPISMDHMSFLGNSIKSITKEKVGIFKKNIPSVIAPQSREALDIIEKESKKKNVTLYRYNSEWKVFIKNKKNFTLKLGNSEYNIRTPKLYGIHQLYNAGTALIVSKVQNKFKLKDNLISHGVSETFWPARMQQIKNGKLKNIVGNNFEIWLDGGHNIHAAEMLKDNFEKWRDKKLFMIFGMVGGKKPEEFLKNLVQYITFLQIIPIQNHKSIYQEEIISIFKNKNLSIQNTKCVNEALENIKKKYSGGRIIICGSLYLAGEILKQNGTKIY